MDFLILKNILLGQAVVRDENPTLRMAYTQKGGAMAQRCLGRLTADFKVVDTSTWSPAQLTRQTKKEAVAPGRTPKANLKDIACQ